MSVLKVTPTEAAEIMGATPQFVRVGLQQGVLNIGTAIKLKEYAYNISPHLLAQRQGLTDEELKAKIIEIRARG